MCKSIRNNWLNQHDYNRTFLYPNFEDFLNTNKAVFKDIRLLYRSEHNSVVNLLLVLLPNPAGHQV